MRLSPARMAADWLQWGGPAGDFTVEVEGLAEWWPPEGPETLWALFYVEWSLNDLKNQSGMDSEAHSRELAELLRGKGFRVVAHEVSDGAGWGSWRAGNDRILESLFPLSVPRVR